MAESLNVIALISGGKDSFFSILHCMRNGHRVVALANLYPETLPSRLGADGSEEAEQDLNSFMFQTVGHTVIPLYEEALEIPLYRQPITGSAVQRGTSYSHPNTASSELGDTLSDETESLVPLLKKIMAEHPSANALSTGAILSTYQRTRVESVALRLGLTPLSYLWKYPILPPGTQTSLLEDMQGVGLDARIVKVASGGLDESFLWESVTSQKVVRRIERAMARFGVDGDGAVLGEGGEFETLVVDGPRYLFKRRIEIQEGDWKVVKEGGGSAWLRVLDAKSMAKAHENTTEVECRIPELFARRFEDIFSVLHKESLPDRLAGVETLSIKSIPPYDLPSNLSPRGASQNDVLYWTIASRRHASQEDISDEAGEIISELKQRLSQSTLQASDIISTTIVLRSMQDFQVVNKVYGAVFTQPNPPSRVTISCGAAMPSGINIILHLKISNSPLLRKALHIQSRSYWAPANIGPYSQAVSTSPLPHNDIQPPWTVHIAGQIPLIPSTMLLPSPFPSALQTFTTQAVLALQHLFRIGVEMHVKWWSSVTAYLPHDPAAAHPSQRAFLAGRAWALAHQRPSSSSSGDDDDVESRDLWEEKHHAGIHQTRHCENTNKSLPDWECVHSEATIEAPPFFAVEVEELPRGSSIEWHAHLGIACGAEGVNVSVVEKEERWAVHRCVFGGRMHVVLMILDSGGVMGIQLEDVIADAGVEGLEYVSASYWDVSLRKGGGEDLLGMIPCRSIWDARGRKLAAILMFDIPL